MVSIFICCEWGGWALLFACREELEPRLLREHPRPSSRDTTESKCESSLKPRSRLTNDFHTNKRIIDDIAIIQSKRLRNQIAGKFTLSVLNLRRFHHSHDEENPKGTSQGNFAEVAGGSECSFFSYLIYYIRKERERWTLFPRDPSSRSRTSRLRTESFATWSATLASRSSSQARRTAELPLPPSEHVPVPQLLPPTSLYE